MKTDPLKTLEDLKYFEIHDQKTQNNLLAKIKRRSLRRRKLQSAALIVSLSGIALFGLSLPAQINKGSATTTSVSSATTVFTTPDGNFAFGGNEGVSRLQLWLDKENAKSKCRPIQIVSTELRKEMDLLGLEDWVIIPNDLSSIGCAVWSIDHTSRLVIPSQK